MGQHAIPGGMGGVGEEEQAYGRGRAVQVQSEASLEGLTVYQKEKLIWRLVSIQHIAEVEAVIHMTRVMTMISRTKPRILSSSSCIYRREKNWSRRSSGWPWMLGYSPMPWTRRIILATLRWLTGRRRVTREWLIWPEVEVKWEMREKFWGRLAQVNWDRKARNRRHAPCTCPAG